MSRSSLRMCCQHILGDSAMERQGKPVLADTFPPPLFREGDQQPILRDMCSSQKMDRCNLGEKQDKQGKTGSVKWEVERGGEVICGSSLQILEACHLKDNEGHGRVLLGGGWPMNSMN